MPTDEFVNFSVRLPKRLHQKLIRLSQGTDRPGILSAALRMIIDAYEDLPELHYVNNSKNNRAATDSNPQRDAVVP